MYPPPYFRRMPYVPYPPNYYRSMPVNPTPPAAAAGGVSKIDQFLKTTDQLMKTAENYKPYIQQAQPLLKNLPALWKLYKGFSAPTPSTDNRRETRPSNTRRPRTNESRSSRVEESRPAVVKENPSTPMIYQPPF